MFKTLAFYGSCDARGNKVLVSKRISQPFWLRLVTVDFQNGCGNLLKVRCLLSEDDSELAASSGGGVSVFGENAQVDYVVGNDRQLVMKHEVEVPQGGAYVKIHGENEDWFDHDVQARVEIEYVSGGGD